MTLSELRILAPDECRCPISTNQVWMDNGNFKRAPPTCASLEHLTSPTLRSRQVLSSSTTSLHPPIALHPPASTLCAAWTSVKGCLGTWRMRLQHQTHHQELLPSLWQSCRPLQC